MCYRELNNPVFDFMCTPMTYAWHTNFKPKSDHPAWYCTVQYTAILTVAIRTPLLSYIFSICAKRLLVPENMIIYLTAKAFLRKFDFNWNSIQVSQFSGMKMTQLELNTPKCAMQQIMQYHVFACLIKPLNTDILRALEPYSIGNYSFDLQIFATYDRKSIFDKS